jgi:hypothetical protein
MGQALVNSSNCSSCASVEVNCDYQQPIQPEMLEQYQYQDYCYSSSNAIATNNYDNNIINHTYCEHMKPETMEKISFNFPHSNISDINVQPTINYL